MAIGTRITSHNIWHHVSHHLVKEILVAVVTPELCGLLSRKRRSVCACTCRCEGPGVGPGKCEPSSQSYTWKCRDPGWAGEWYGWHLLWRWAAMENGVPGISYSVVGLLGRKSGRSDLQDWLVTFPGGFPSDFTYGKLAKKFANGDMITGMLWQPQTKSLVLILNKWL